MALLYNGGQCAHCTPVVRVPPIQLCSVCSLPNGGWCVPFTVVFSVPPVQWWSKCVQSDVQCSTLYKGGQCTECTMVVRMHLYSGDKNVYFTVVVNVNMQIGDLCAQCIIVVSVPPSEWWSVSPFILVVYPV